MPELILFNLGILQTNCYLVKNGLRAVLVDAGGEGFRVNKYLEEKHIKLEALLLTHGHADHILGAEEVCRKNSCPAFIHEADLGCLHDEVYNVAGNLGVSCDVDIEDVRTVKDGDRLSLAGMDFQVIHTPGHTRGSVCYDMGEILFSGDTLFCGSRGRTDFPGSSDEEMLSSLKRLKALEGDRQVLPGHNSLTTLERERQTNPNMRYL